MCALPVGTVAGELYTGARLRPPARERLALPLLCLSLLPYLGYALRPGLAVPSCSCWRPGPARRTPWAWISGSCGRCHGSGLAPVLRAAAEA
ncbi:hypothetical protein ACF1GT_13115 [Streptomyces sp. NPDC014636]|uniref:hypothetical protein n=1 Tax=Streptomyces sp. NPDC014636 TaxID=3364876 RepID=UPI0036FA5909